MAQHTLCAKLCKSYVTVHVCLQYKTALDMKIIVKMWCIIMRAQYAADVMSIISNSSVQGRITLVRIAAVVYSAEKGAQKSKDSTVASPDPMMSFIIGVKHVRVLKSAVFATSIFAVILLVHLSSRCIDSQRLHLPIVSVVGLTLPLHVKHPLYASKYLTARISTLCKM